MKVFWSMICYTFRDFFRTPRSIFDQLEQMNLDSISQFIEPTTSNVNAFSIHQNDSFGHHHSGYSPSTVARECKHKHASLCAGKRKPRKTQQIVRLAQRQQKRSSPSFCSRKNSNKNNFWGDTNKGKKRLTRDTGYFPFCPIQSCTPHAGTTPRRKSSLPRPQTSPSSVRWVRS